MTKPKPPVPDAVAQLLEALQRLTVEDRTRFLVEAWRAKWSPIPHPRVTGSVTPEEPTA